uniref:Putative product n=1 Tax=Xenopsylla cheopis TaxID=163159 RepID=A0A6M2DXA1_XENCH
MLPLVLISPFTLYAIFPSLTANVREKDLTRGELNLYEMNDNFIDGVFVATCKYILLQGTRMFASMLAATILCRHLMVWKIFAPKFLFDGFSVLITLIFTVFSFIFVLRINHHVGKLVSKITKAS